MRNKAGVRVMKAYELIDLKVVEQKCMTKKGVSNNLWSMHMCSATLNQQT